MTRWIAALVLVFGVGGCGAIYQSPKVNSFRDGDTKIRVQPITPESVLAANRSSYTPKSLPSAFYATAGANTSGVGGGAIPRPIEDPSNQTRALQLSVPPAVQNAPYRVGIGDVLLLATPQVGSTVAQLTGLLAASNARQGYTVQDDGAIAIPNVGRVQVANLTLEDAESVLFQRLVENQIDPTFSLEVAEFNSQKVSIGGAVARPTVVPIGLSAVTLDEALAAAGGVTAENAEFASVRIYRDGTLYQIPLSELYSTSGLQRTRLADGDSIFVDTQFQLDQAQAYFQQEIRAAEFRQRARINALNELQAAVNIRRSAQQDARQNFQARLELGDVDRDYVYLTGEVKNQARFALPFGQTATLADALFDNGGLPIRTADVSQIYVLRGSADPREFGAVTAWQLDGRDATNFVLASRFELRPNDIVFIAEQPVTRWSRVVTQITPTLINTAANVATAAN